MNARSRGKSQGPVIVGLTGTGDLLKPVDRQASAWMAALSASFYVELLRRNLGRLFRFMMILHSISKPLDNKVSRA